MRAIIYWLLFPWRVLAYSFRFAFGHPVPSIAILVVLTALFSYMSTMQITPDVQATSTGNAQRTVTMFPAAGALAAVCAMLCGILLIWMSEHFNKPITTWTTAPSILAKRGMDAAP